MRLRSGPATARYCQLYQLHPGGSYIYCGILVLTVVYFLVWDCVHCGVFNVTGRLAERVHFAIRVLDISYSPLPSAISLFQSSPSLPNRRLSYGLRTVLGIGAGAAQQSEIISSVYFEAIIFRHC